jgi:hypothetical protein
VKIKLIAPPIVATIAAIAGCAPLEPVEPVAEVDDGDAICSVEAPIGSHIKEEACGRPGGQWGMGGAGADDGVIDDDSSGVFRTVKIERFESRPRPLPEAKCGSQNSN